MPVTPDLRLIEGGYPGTGLEARTDEGDSTRKHAKTVLRLADLEDAKSGVLRVRSFTQQLRYSVCKGAGA